MCRMTNPGRSSSETTPDTLNMGVLLGLEVRPYNDNPAAPTNDNDLPSQVWTFLILVYILAIYILAKEFIRRVRGVEVGACGVSPTKLVES